ncbi:hypothetical protein GMRT_11495 [Giardia muris]|uniref:NlpC/P60 domain-containing protein n=1 Tax=Giardia muris TaxID=5742 RepID=A0A4Z1TB88_GIAMU|nr:hypothetical protein GMRT_11495 [Giardia muris]|eukprot:TNJ29799.1 hypothetical protein GMRT_11495 [Giardia muris]
MSLQESFLVFLEKKRAERAQMRARAKTNERTPEERQALRRQFVEKALSYCGTPYSRKEHPEGSELATWPIQLDCCGLVRQVLYDMEEQLGFRPLPYNQAYQFDTLPDRYESHTQLQPGDLIFYEGTYFDAKKRPQKHNMVHVEIYLGGDGSEESCVGSRFRKQTVSVFDSYRFTSTSWELKKIHYCSIEPWLNGVCVSACPLHQWEKGAGGRRIKGSIFDPLEEEDLCSDAGDE